MRYEVSPQCFAPLPSHPPLSDSPTKTSPIGHFCLRNDSWRKSLPRTERDRTKVENVQILTDTHKFTSILDFITFVLFQVSFCSVCWWSDCATIGCLIFSDNHQKVINQLTRVCPFLQSVQVQVWIWSLCKTLRSYLKRLRRMSSSSEMLVWRVAAKSCTASNPQRRMASTRCWMVTTPVIEESVKEKMGQEDTKMSTSTLALASACHYLQSGSLFEMCLACLHWGGLSH